MSAPRVLAITPPTGVDEFDAAQLIGAWRSAGLHDKMAVLLRRGPQMPRGPLGLGPKLRALGDACTAAGLPCFVALSPDPDASDAAPLCIGAAKLGLAGVHLKSGWTPQIVAAWAQAARQLELELALSGHQGDPALPGTLDAALAYRSFAPVFAPRTQSGHAKPAVGLQALATYAGTSAAPVLALGGLRPDRIAPCLDHGAHGVASIRALFGAVDELNDYGQALHRALASRVSQEP